MKPKNETHLSYHHEQVMLLDKYLYERTWPENKHNMGELHTEQKMIEQMKNKVIQIYMPYIRRIYLMKKLYIL
jgi:hypothetical protein